MRESSASGASAEDPNTPDIDAVLPWTGPRDRIAQPSCSVREPSTATDGDATLQFLTSTVRHASGGRVLNLGAGFPPSTVFPAVCHVDLDSVPLRSGAGQRVAASADELPFERGRFSAVLMKDVLEHVQRPIETLQEVRRVSVENAYLMLTVPRAIPRAVWNDPTHVRGFTRHALETALTLSGWKLVGPIRRMGSIPGAGRFGLSPDAIELLLRLPIAGHRLGTNWIVHARALGRPVDAQRQ